LKGPEATPGAATALCCGPMAVASPVASTRERLARTALRLFAERGYAGVSNREIVEACGLTKGAIYWYFENKEHLFRTVLAEALADFQERIVASIAPVTGWRARLTRVFRLFVEVLESEDDPHRDLLMLLIHQFPGEGKGPGQGDLARATQQRLVGWIGGVVADYDGPIEAADLAALIHATGLGVLAQTASGTGDPRSVLTSLLRLLGAGEV